MKAALRDPLPFAKPDTRTERKYHAATQAGRPMCNLATVLDPATIVDAATVGDIAQCGRPPCAEAFALAASGDEAKW